MDGRAAVHRPPPPPPTPPPPTPTPRAVSHAICIALRASRATWPFSRRRCYHATGIVRAREGEVYRLREGETTAARYNRNRARARTERVSRPGIFESTLERAFGERRRAKEPFNKAISFLKDFLVSEKLGGVEPPKMPVPP